MLSRVQNQLHDDKHKKVMEEKEKAYKERDENTKMVRAYADEDKKMSPTFRKALNKQMQKEDTIIK